MEKAIKDNLFFGINFGVGFSKNSNSLNADSVRSHAYHYGIFVRKYKPLKNNFYLFLQGNLGGSNAKSDFIQNPNGYFDAKYFGINASVSPGISYGINSRLQLETGFNSIVGIGYSTQKYSSNLSNGGERKQTGFNLYTNLSNFNSQFYMGFRLLLQKKNRMVPSVKQR